MLFILLSCENEQNLNEKAKVCNAEYVSSNGSDDSMFKITESKALEYANIVFNRSKTRAMLDITLDYVVEQPISRAAMPDTLAYIFNRGENEGFVVISADSRINPLLAFSEKGHFDNNNEVVYLTPDANSVAIGLLTDSVSLAAEGDSVVVKTQKQIWWLVGFDFYEDSDPRSKCGYYNCTSDERRESHWGVWVNYQWLSVYASSHDKLVKIKVDKNTTGKTRYWRVVLEIGDIFNSVYCQQSSM